MVVMQKYSSTFEKATGIKPKWLMLEQQRYSGDAARARGRRFFGVSRRLASAPVDFISRGVARDESGRAAVLVHDPDGHALCLLD
jgi:hypothetical protein